MEESTLACRVDGSSHNKTSTCRIPILLFFMNEECYFLPYFHAHMHELSKWPTLSSIQLIALFFNKPCASSSKPTRPKDMFRYLMAGEMRRDETTTE